MFARYLRSRVGADATRYELQEEGVRLFGCKEGFVPWLLRFKLPSAQGEPCQWHVDVVAELGSHADYPNSTLIIDLKPKQKQYLSLYEVMDVWGHSENDWTPILLRLNALFVDEDPSIDRNSFLVKDQEICVPIYEFLYVNGSIKDGKIDGRWTLPGISSTNGALLWPKALNYFFKCIRATTPDVLET